jgi:hypothetical protein
MIDFYSMTALDIALFIGFHTAVYFQLIFKFGFFAEVNPAKKMSGEYSENQFRYFCH